ncbi:hypothetical protein N7474_003417 [Penicillium riverlandense]|uniref:uncharacterized protein n=1 Tax=Penicillium riverlandense TaxID=1903569 RepID=UPI002547C19A|nr:uncharacterized protein N7474_003417 [Penicillium riverlandense]KAJ5826279.1 hypothetical protein N7474_003417 [Penicillium riverlandense]
MKYATRDIPFSWYWKGKPLHKGQLHGERIRPVYLGVPDIDTLSLAGCSSDSSIESTTAQATHSRCEGCNEHAQHHGTLSGSDCPVCDKAKKRCQCHHAHHDPMPTQKTAKAKAQEQCSCGHHLKAAHTPAKPATSAATPHHRCCMAPKGHCCEHHHHHQGASCPASPVLAVPCPHHSDDSHRHKMARSRRSSRRRSNAETEARCPNFFRTCDCYSDVAYHSVDDDMMSEISVDVGAGSDGDTDESRCPHHHYPSWWAYRPAMGYGRR